MKKLILSFLTISLAACTAKIEPHKEKVQTQNGSTVEVIYGIGQPGYGKPREMSEKERYFRVITRADMAKRIAGQGIFCNPLSLFALIGACSWNGLLNKDTIEGELTKLPNVALSYAYPQYLNKLKQHLHFSDTKDYSSVPVYFYPSGNYLVYDDDHYVLKAGFQIHIEGSRIDGAFLCKEEKSGIPYEKWKENNYALAVQEGKKLMDNCLNRLDKLHFEHVRELLEHNRKYFL